MKIVIGTNTVRYGSYHIENVYLQQFWVCSLTASGGEHVRIRTFYNSSIYMVELQDIDITKKHISSREGNEKETGGTVAAYGVVLLEAGGWCNEFTMFPL